MSSSSLLPSLLLGSAVLVGCGSSTPALATQALGGGSVAIYAAADAPSTCPTSHPNRLVVSGQILCADAAFDVGLVTRADCTANAIDCEALYGCVTQPLTACDATATTADCGGDGPGVLACQSACTGVGAAALDCGATSMGGCRWFVGGCVADSFEPSACPEQNTCCELSASAAYAGDSWAGLRQAADAFVQSYGNQPIALDDGFVLDLVAAEPSGLTAASVTCPTTQTDYFDMFLCGGSSWPVSASGGPSSWRLTATSSTGSVGFHVETRMLASGATAGRVCRYELLDAYSGTCSSASPTGPRCATSGTITVGTTGVRAEVDFGNGAWVLDIPTLP